MTLEEAKRKCEQAGQQHLLAYYEELTKEDQEKLLAQIEKLYYEAFPVEEQKPFSVILEKNREGSMEILAAENNHKDFTGLAITARHRDLVMLDYFAISPCHRQGGVGSKVFRMLKERYAGQRFFRNRKHAGQSGKCRTAQTAQSLLP